MKARLDPRIVVASTHGRAASAHGREAGAARTTPSSHGCLPITGSRCSRGESPAHAGSTAGGAPRDCANALAYYSFVTLTTMGYGDITPLHPAARSASIL